MTAVREPSLSSARIMNSAQPPQVRREGRAARARDASSRQEWQEGRKKPALELPASQAQEPSIQPVSDPEQEDQEVLPIAKCPNPTMVVETDKEIPDDNSDVIPQLDGPAEKASDTIATLELNDIGDITGPELAPNSSPPARVFHPKAGAGVLHGEPPDPTDEDSFYSYIFPDDPNAFVMMQVPGKGQKMESIMEVFKYN